MIIVMLSRSSKVLINTFAAHLNDGDIAMFLPETNKHVTEYLPEVRKVLEDYAPEKEVRIATNLHHTISLIGDMIEDGKLSHEEVSILIFDDKGSVEFSCFDEEGDLVDWPFGFFQEGV